MSDKALETTSKQVAGGQLLEPILDKSANTQFTKSQQEAAGDGQSSLPSVEVGHKPLTGGIEKHGRADLSEQSKSSSQKTGIEETNTKLDPMQASPDTFCQDVKANLFKGEIMTICGEIPNKYKSLLELSRFFYAFDDDQKRINKYKQMMHSGLPTSVNPATEWYTPKGNSISPIWPYLYKTLAPSVQRRFEQMAAKHHLPITQEPIKLEK